MVIFRSEFSGVAAACSSMTRPRFFYGLVWTVGPTVEIKRFYISPVLLFSRPMDDV